MIKAIETIYKGYRFRSRLEARWAVILDALKVHWAYEDQGYEFNGIRYLPDFWLPDLNVWMEIKANEPLFCEWAKAMTLTMESGHTCFIAWGLHYALPLISMDNFTEAPPHADYWLWPCGHCGKLSIVATCWLMANCYEELGDEPAGSATKLDVLNMWGCRCHDTQPLLTNGTLLQKALDAGRQARFEFGEHGGR